MGSLDTESVQLAEATARKLNELYAMIQTNEQAIATLTARVDELEAGGGGGDQFAALGVTIDGLNEDGELTMTKDGSTFTFTGTLP